MDSLKLSFIDQLPGPTDCPRSSLLIYDEVLEKKFSRWIKSFPKRYKVRSGETLKEIENFPKHLKSISKLISDQSPRSIQIIAFGGGSVGDFAGFVASIYKRGVHFTQIPSTWLSAIDSAHGGKTALNVGGAKNQVGTFYPAAEIYCVQEVLFSQPQIRADEAIGELIKIALLEGNELYQKVVKLSEPIDHQKIWSVLGPAIEAKYKVVAQDPYEETGYRHLLNFGHTLGHALEAVHKLPHGIAINIGIQFALKWSIEKGYLEESEYQQILQTPIGSCLIDLESYLTPTKIKTYLRAMTQDKKKTSTSKLRFIFLKSPGNPLIEEVSLKELEKFLLKLERL